MYYCMEDHLIHLCLTYFVLPRREWRKLRSILEGGHQLGKRMVEVNQTYSLFN